MRIRILSLLLLALAACSPGPFSTPQTTATLPLASPTPVLTQTPTLVPTETPTATAAPVPTPESSPIATPSDMKEPALELLRTNNGCKLPCWWGITPGTTTWADAEAFLEPFSHIDVEPGTDGWRMAYARSPIEEKYSPLIGEVRMDLGVYDSTVQEIDAHDFDEPSWHLDRFLSAYGSPSQVYISTYSRDSGMPANTVPFSIVLFYPDLGISAIFDSGDDARVVGSEIVGCLHSPSLFLWDPKNRVTFEYASQWKDVFYLPLEAATDMDIDQFYGTYKDSSTRSCIETPTNLWPDQ